MDHFMLPHSVVELLQVLSPPMSSSLQTSLLNNAPRSVFPLLEPAATFFGAEEEEEAGSSTANRMLDAYQELCKTCSTFGPTGEDVMSAYKAACDYVSLELAEMSNNALAVPLLTTPSINVYANEEQYAHCVLTERYRDWAKEAKVPPQPVARSKKRGANLALNIKNAFQAWADAHPNNPYPSREEKEQLRLETGASPSQLQVQIVYLCRLLLSELFFSYCTHCEYISSPPPPSDKLPSFPHPNRTGSQTIALENGSPQGRRKERIQGGGNVAGADWLVYCHGDGARQHMK